MQHALCVLVELLCYLSLHPALNVLLAQSPSVLVQINSGSADPTPLVYMSNFTADGGSAVLCPADGRVYSQLVNAVDDSPAWSVVDPTQPARATLVPLPAGADWLVALAVEPN